MPSRTRRLVMLLCALLLLITPIASAQDAPPEPDKAPREITDVKIDPPAPGDAESSKKKLARAAVVAVIEKDAEALSKLTFTFDDLSSGCAKVTDSKALAAAMIADMPAEVIEEMGGRDVVIKDTEKRAVEMQKHLEESFSSSARLDAAKMQLERCAAFDFAAAKPVEVIGGEAMEDQILDNLCPENGRFKDIEVVFEHEGRRARIQLDTPAKIGGRHGILDEVECLIEDPKPTEGKKGAPKHFSK